MSKPLSWPVKITLFLLIFCSTERFCRWQTGGFSLSKMLIEDCLSSVENPSDPLFSQPLTFLGAGNQFYAFETEDRRTVVKFMKFSRRRRLPWLEKITLPPLLETWKQNYLGQRANRLFQLQQSSALALHHLKEETGLISAPALKQTATLVDKLGIHHQINLSQTRYLIQKKAIPFTEYFDQNPSQAETLIQAYIKTVVSQCKKGICNLDPMLERNFGIADGRMIVLDIGSFKAHEKLKTPAKLQCEIILELLPLREWLQKKYPQYLTYFDASLKKQSFLLSSSHS